MTTIGFGPNEGTKIGAEWKIYSFFMAGSGKKEKGGFMRNEFQSAAERTNTPVISRLHYLP